MPVINYAITATVQGLFYSTHPAMHKIGIYIYAPQGLLIIETPATLQFELCDSNGNLLITGNKLQQPGISINIARLAKGSYTLKLHIDGQQLYKTIEL